MIYKVLFQEIADEVPVRERTKSIYVEADSVREVRELLKNREYNIEYIQKLDEAHLAYEKKSDTFALEKF